MLGTLSEGQHIVETGCGESECGVWSKRQKGYQDRRRELDEADYKSRKECCWMRMLRCGLVVCEECQWTWGRGPSRGIVPSWETTSVGLPAFLVFELTAVKSQKRTR